MITPHRVEKLRTRWHIWASKHAIKPVHRLVANEYPIDIARAQMAPVVTELKVARHSLCHTLAFDPADVRVRGRTHQHDRLVLFVQTHWDTPAESVARTVDYLKRYAVEVKTVFLDWYAPLHIKQPDLLEVVDVYVKKQILKDRERYAAGLYDTNLVEYESQWNPAFSDVPSLRVDRQLLDQKLFLGWNFATHPPLIELLNQERHRRAHRIIDVHCRIAAPPSRNSWYAHMRGRAFDAVHGYAKRQYASSKVLCQAGRIERSAFYDELTQSKICISPFGYGEVCWRDFEAIACGAALVKPDMRHLETNPDLFVPDETYVPVRWDFSDLDEVLENLLEDDERRLRITSNAAAAWRAFLDREWGRVWSSLCGRVGINPNGDSTT